MIYCWFIDDLLLIIGWVYGILETQSWNTYQPTGIVVFFVAHVRWCWAAVQNDGVALAYAAAELQSSREALAVGAGRGDIFFQMDYIEILETTKV